MQAFLLCFTLLTHATLGATQADDAAATPHRRVKRIVGGYPSDVRQLPYMVNIRKRGFFICGGALLTPRCVLTAAHCVKDVDARDLVVRGGNTYLDDRRNSRSVRHIYVPPQYDRVALDHDIGMLMLRSPLEGNNIAPIQLAWTTPEPGAFVQVTGWGLTHGDAFQLPNQMHTVHVQVMAQSKCQALYQGYRNITDKMFCASVPGLRDACTADSGGPAVADNRLVGIVSWGKGKQCADAAAPGVYANVVRLRDWIEATLWQNF